MKLNYDDYWVIEIEDRRDHWTDDETGPHSLYEDKAGALEYAARLAIIFHVRLRHVVTTYEEI